jgi:hypothetical protein
MFKTPCRQYKRKSLKPKSTEMKCNNSDPYNMKHTKTAQFLLFKEMYRCLI